MGISKKKRQYIKRNYPGLSINKIAEKTGLCVQDVENVLGINNSDDKMPLSSILKLLLEKGLPVCVFLSPFIILPGIRNAADLPQNAFVQISILFLSSVWAVKSITDKELKCVFPPFLMWPFIVFVLWCILCLFAAVNFFEGVKVVLQVVAMFIGFFMTVNIYYFCDDMHDNPDSLIMAIVFAGAGVAVIGIVQNLFGFSMIPQARPPAATFANRNMAAQFMVVSFPFSLGLFLMSEKKYLTWFAGIVSALILVYAVYTRALAAWISISIELVVLFCLLLYLKTKKKWKFGLKTKVLPLVVVMLIFMVLINTNSKGVNLKFGGISAQLAVVKQFADRFIDNKGSSFNSEGIHKSSNMKNGRPVNDESRLKINGKVAHAREKQKKVSSIEWRWTIWLNSMAMFRDNLLHGVGPGNFKIQYPLYHQTIMKDQKFSIKFQPIRCHNDYIQAAAELGLPGLILIISMILCFYFIGFSLIRFSPDFKDTSGDHVNILLAGIILSAGTGILLNACFSFPFQRAIPPFMLMLMAALISGMYAVKKKIRYYKIKNSFILYFTAICLVSASLYYSHFYYSEIQFDKFYGRTIVCYNEARWQNLLIEADKALKYGPDEKEILFYMGLANYKLGKIEKSIKHYRELLKYYPHYLNGLINIGLSYGKLNRNKKAFAAYKKLIRILPDNPGFYNDAGHYLQEDGRFDMAYEYFKKAVALGGNNAIIQANFGIACMMMKKYPEALKAFQKALQLKPGWQLPLQYIKIMGQHRPVKN